MVVDLLGDLLKLNIIEDTGRKDQLPIDSANNIYTIYRIPLKYLFYNDRNDRIATEICKYKDEHGEDSINIERFEEYNSIIQSFIESANMNSDSLDNTKKNIKENGQKKFGIVLNDGRVIDGNRRFTCLRQLYKETGDPRYSTFDAAILNKNIEYSEKSIKRLELSIQIGEEEKESYNPIDRLVGVYRDIEESKMFTVKEYANCTNTDEDDVLELLHEAELMVEMLDTIGAPKQYYLLKEFKLQGSLYEMAHMVFKKRNKLDKKLLNGYKLMCFANMIAKPKEGVNLYIRDINHLDRDNLEFLIDKQKDDAIEIIDELNSKDKVTLDDWNVIKSDRERAERLSNALSFAKERMGRQKKRNSPRANMTSALQNLKDVDSKILAVLDLSEILELQELYSEIDSVMESLKKELSNVSKSKTTSNL